MNDLRRFVRLRLWWWHNLWRLRNAKLVLRFESSLKTLAYISIWAVFLAPLLTLGVLGVIRLGGDQGETAVELPLVFQGLEASLKWQFLAAAGFFLILFIRSAHRRHNRLLICAFRTYLEKAGKGAGSEGEEPSSGAALASCIQNELDRLLELFRTIDEASVSGSVSGPVSGSGSRSLSDSGKSVQVTPTVLGEQESTLLAGTVSPEVKLKAGLLEIPLGFVVSAFERLFPAPRLAGSLHEGQDGRLTLLATLRGGGYFRSWRVDSSELAGSPPGRLETVERMAQNLVYRMAADLLPSLGSPRWQAVRHYSEGLRMLRPTFRTHAHEDQNLSRAKKCFREALREDESFAPCHFNLGYVYKQMNAEGCPEAAVAAFRWALKERPDDVGACYAVAQICFENGRYDDAIWLSRNALHLDPHHAAARNLLALSSWQRDEMRRESTGESGSQEKVLHHARRDFEVATADAWRALCKAQWRKRNVRESMEIVRTSEMNLGITCSLEERHRASEAAFRRALRVRPNDHEICFEQGKARWRAGQWKDAYESLDRVLREGLDPEDQADLWPYLLSVHSMLHEAARGDEIERGLHWSEVLDCYRLGLDTAALFGPDPDAAERSLERLRDCVEEVRDSEVEVNGELYLSRFIRCLAFLQRLARRTAPELERMLRSTLGIQAVPAMAQARNDLTWKRTQVTLRLALLEANAFLNPGHGGKAQPPKLADVLRSLSQALAGVEDCRLSEKLEIPLRLACAQVCLAGARQQSYDGRPDPDLLEAARIAARRAIALNPEGSEERRVLNEVDEVAAELAESEEAEARGQIPQAA